MMHGFRRPERDAQSNVQHTCGVVPGSGRRPPVVRAFLELDEMGTGGAERAVVVEQGEEQRNGELGGSPERSAAAESVERELMLLFRRARSLSATAAAVVHPKLDPASYALLLLIQDAGPLRGMDLAERTGLDKSTISRQLASLVELGLLERVPDPDDRRARLLQLSEEGQQRLAYARAVRSKHLRKRFADWPTHDLRELARLLSRLNDFF